MQTLSPNDIDKFINNGFVKIENAFSEEIADECCAILWKASQCHPEDPGSWTKPVIRISELKDEPFKKAVNTNILHNAFDQLVGKNNWLPRESLGSFMLRFPCKQPAADTGWHVGASFPGENIADYLHWRININSKGRALLMLFLFTDVSEQDAPTIIKVASHFAVAKMLEPGGEKGLSFMELAQKLHTIPKSKEALATGKRGTVYLCHPFIVHAAQNIRGTKPKFMAQPPLLPKDHFNINRSTDKLSPVELAIAKGLK